MYDHYDYSIVDVGDDGNVVMLLNKESGATP